MSSFLGHMLGEAGRKKEVFAVFSRSRRTRYAMPGSSWPYGVYTRTRCQAEREHPDRISHAVQHLYFIGAFGHAIIWARPWRAPGCDVVAAERGAQPVVISAGTASCVRSWRRSAICGRTRVRPIFLGADDRLAVPVCSLDEPNPDRSALFHPRQQLVQIVFAGMQIPWMAMPA